MKIQYIIVFVVLFMNNINACVTKSDYLKAKQIEKKVMSFVYDIDSYLVKNEFYSNLRKLHNDLEMRKSFLKQFHYFIMQMPSYTEISNFKNIEEKLELIIDNYLKYMLIKDQQGGPGIPYGDYFELKNEILRSIDMSLDILDNYYSTPTCCCHCCHERVDGSCSCIIL